MRDETVTITKLEHQTLTDIAKQFRALKKRDVLNTIELDTTRNELDLRIALDEQNFSSSKMDARNHLKRLNKAFNASKKYYPTQFEAVEQRNIESELERMSEALR